MLLKEQNINFSIGKIISFFIFINLFYGCNSEVVNPSDNNLNRLGLEGKIPIKVVWSEPYLYACATVDGLWRKEIGVLKDWEYLGLANDSLSRELPRGVLDAAINGPDIIVAYNEAESDVVSPDKSIGIWRSTNDGKNWFRADEGVPQTITSKYEFNTFYAIKRSPYNSSTLFNIVAPAVYKSIDNGYTWQLVNGSRGSLHSLGNLKFNPNREGEIWFYGETSTMSPFLYCTKDNGLSFKKDIEFSNFRLPSDNTVIDVSFDSVNPDLLYAVTSAGIIKSQDGGDTWFEIKPDMSDGQYISLLESSGKSDGIFAFGGQNIFYSVDGLKTVKVIGKIPEGEIISTDIDLKNKIIFLGTTYGVYTYSIKDILTQ